MTATGDQAFLEIRQSSAKLGRIFLPMVVFFILLALVGLTDSGGHPVGVFALVMATFFTLLGAVTVVHARRAGPELLIDETGVTVPGHPTIGWDDFAAVRVRRLLRFGFIRFGDLNDVVAFIPRPGVALPSLPSAPKSRYLSAFARRQRERRYGTPLAIFPSTMTVTTDNLLATIRRFTDIPVQ